MVNGPDSVYIERNGKIEETDGHLRRRARTCAASSTRSSARSAVASTSRRRWSTPASPTAPVSTRSSTRSPSAGPSSPSGSSPRTRYQIDDLIRFGTLSPAGRPSSSQALRRRPAEHHRLRRYRHRQDDDAQRAVVVHPGRRAHRHHRGRRGAPAPAGARALPGDPAAQHRGQGRDHHPRPRAQLPAHAARPHRRRRVPWRRGPRHAPGHEHRPRRLAHHDPRQQPRATRSPVSRP